MKYFTRLICILLLLGATLSVSSRDLKGVSVPDSDKQTVELVINGDKYPIQNVSPNAQVDVYSIIGTKVTSFRIKAGACDSSITLPKGYYILKIEDSTRKIAVK